MMVVVALVLVGLTELHGLQRWASREVEGGVEVCGSCGPSLFPLQACAPVSFPTCH